jgi:parallel beta-helix repeat protein
MRTRRFSAHCGWLAAGVVAIGLAFPGGALAGTIIVRDGDSIQDAVDAANPGDTIIVKAGTYTGTTGGSVVTVQKSGITIQGSTSATIDAAGFEYGIMVGDDAPISAAGCPPITVEGFELKGLTIQNATETGVRLVGVDGYKLSHSRYLDNEEYGPFPVCSRNGEISHNFASGHNDAAIYVGDDVNTVVRNNVAVDSVVGAEIENSLNSVVTHNTFEGNAAGLLVFVGPGLPMAFNESVYVAHNNIRNNNRTNTGLGSVAGVPEGTGILVFGSDDVTVEHNDITGNDSFGIAITGNFNVFLDPRIEPFNDDVVVQKNDIRGNGANPDPLRTFTPGADIVFLPDVFDPGPITGMPGALLLVDPDPSDNCFDKNQFEVDFPPGVVDAFPCP